MVIISIRYKLPLQLHHCKYSDATILLRLHSMPHIAPAQVLPTNPCDEQIATKKLSFTCNVCQGLEHTPTDINLLSPDERIRSRTEQLAITQCRRAVTSVCPDGADVVWPGRPMQ